MGRALLAVFLGLILTAVPLATAVVAQPMHGFEGGFQDRLTEIKRTQLGPAVGVNQETVNRLLGIDQRYKPLRRQLIMEMKNDWRHLQQVLNQPSPNQEEVKGIMADMKRKRLEMLNLQQRKDDEEMALLTPVQQARYMMYLMSLVRQARHVREAPAGGPPAGGPPAGEFGGPKVPREIPAFRPTQ